MSGNKYSRVKFNLGVVSGDDAITADPFGELHTLLTGVLEKVRTGSTTGTLWDTNGNLIGSWILDLEETESDDE